MRAILNAAYQNHSNERLDIFCPSLSNQELVEVVNFLYRGQFTSPDEIKACRILENLTEVFGFPKSLTFMVQTKTETIDYSGGYDLTNDIDIDNNFIQHYDDIEAIDCVIVDDPIAPKF